MRKYKIYFETEVQTDGWTDFRDREYKKISETITLLAKNKTQAIIKSIKNSKGYYYSSWGPSKLHKWNKYQIKRIKFVTMTKTSAKSKKTQL